MTTGSNGESLPSRLERLRAILEVLLVGLTGDVVVAPLLLFAFGARPEGGASVSAPVFCFVLVTKATFILLLVNTLLLLRGRPAILRWGRRPFWGETLRGLLVTPLLFGVIAAVGLLFQVFLPHLVTEQNPLLGMVETPLDFIFFLFTGIYVGGLQEEVQRGFVLEYFDRYLGGALPGLLIWSAFFGWAHSTQGVDNAVKAALLGLMFGLFYLRGRDLTSPIVAHATFNSVTIFVFWLFVR